METQSPLDRLLVAVKAGGDASADKCYAEDPVAWRAYGGATSFAEYELWRDAQEAASAVADETMVFQSIVANILTSDDLSLADRARAVRSAADELAARLDDVETADGGDDGEGERASVWASLFHKAASKREGGVAYRASDYADVPDASKPSTWKLRMAEGRSGRFTTAQVARAITALQPGGFRGNRVEIGSTKSAVVGRISSAIGKIRGATDEQRDALRERLAKVKAFPAGFDAGTSAAGSATAFKDAAGDWKWMAVWSNKFEDREGEIFAESAHREFNDYVARTGAYPDLRLWHVDGTRLGPSEMIAYDDRGFQVAVGSFDPAMTDVAERLADMSPLGVSHGFVYPTKDFSDGVYHRYRSFEISLLPAERAANALTVGISTEVGAMGMDNAQREWMSKVLGPERFAALDGAIGELAAKAADEGIAFKDVAAALTPETPSETSAATPSPDAAPAVTLDAKAIGDAVTEALGVALAPLSKRLDDQDAAIKALAKGVDDRVAEILSPRRMLTEVLAASAEGASKEADAAIVERVRAEQNDPADGVPSFLRPHLDMLSKAPAAATGAPA